MLPFYRELDGDEIRILVVCGVMYCSPKSDLKEYTWGI